jgi:excisionase family DNA binding protein
MENERLLLSAREAAERLGISEKTLWSYTIRAGNPKGTIPSVRIGSRVLYSVAALGDWIAQQQEYSMKA